MQGFGIWQSKTLAFSWKIFGRIGDRRNGTTIFQAVQPLDSFCGIFQQALPSEGRSPTKLRPSNAAFRIGTTIEDRARARCPHRNATLSESEIRGAGILPAAAKKRTDYPDLI